MTRPRLTITRDVAGKITWADFYQVLSTTNDLVRSSADFLLALGNAVGVEVQVAEPMLDTISFGSPGGAGLSIDLGIAESLRLILA